MVVDDKLETSITVRRHQPPSTLPEEAADVPPPNDELDNQGDASLGMNMDTSERVHGASSLDPAQPTSCLKAKDSTAQLIDCEACLEESEASIPSSLSAEEVSVAARLLEDVRDAGEDGLCKPVSVLACSSPY